LKKYVKKKYFSEIYYEINTKEFYELRLIQITMDDMINKFIKLLIFVPYTKEEKVKIQKFLTCLPQLYKDIIEFDNPKALNEVFRKAYMCMEGKETRQNESAKERLPTNPFLEYGNFFPK
jgi:hypothetical protein